MNIEKIVADAILEELNALKPKTKKTCLEMLKQQIEKYAKTNDFRDMDDIDVDVQKIKNRIFKIEYRKDWGGHGMPNEKGLEYLQKVEDFVDSEFYNVKRQVAAKKQLEWI